MFCKMDVDDTRFAHPRFWRKRACGCATLPGPPNVRHGCLCACGAQCLECPGFGYAQAPEKRFHQILSRVRSVIRRRVRTRGRPPGFVRLSREEIRVLVRKRRAEESDHWICEYVDIGPPVRIFDVIVVTDRRKR